MTEAQRTAMSVPVNARFRSLGDERHNNDSQQWRQVLSALTTVGVVEGDIDEVLTLLAATLHCGELKFSSTDEEGSTVANAPRGQLVGRLLGVSEADLVLALTTKVTAFRNEKIVKALTTRQATDCSRAIAKAVYGRLFSWIVSRINAVLATGQAADNATSIGLLDIFGFENFAVNSFEQVCINLANEKLQFYFNEHIFRQELDEYKAEGLGGIALTYSDNTAVLELLTKRPLSVMTILDEESRMQSASDSSFSQKIAQHLEPKVGVADYRLHARCADAPLLHPTLVNSRCTLVVIGSGSHILLTRLLSCVLCRRVPC
jgi:myosin heavy subunit